MEEALSAKGSVNWCKFLESNMIVKERREMKVSRKGKWPNIYTTFIECLLCVRHGAGC